MHVIRKFVAATLALTLLLISSVPVTSAATCRMMDGMRASDTAMSKLAMQIEPVSPLIGWQDGYIECGCRIDTHLDGMPHQLAPHALSMNSDTDATAFTTVAVTPAPALTGRTLSFSPPPPRTL